MGDSMRAVAELLEEQAMESDLERVKKIREKMSDTLYLASMKKMKELVANIRRTAVGTEGMWRDIKALEFMIDEMR